MVAAPWSGHFAEGRRGALAARTLRCMRSLNCMTMWRVSLSTGGTGCTRMVRARSATTRCSTCRRSARHARFQGSITVRTQQAAP